MDATETAARPAARISDDVVDCGLGDGAAILDLASGTYYSLGESGALVWEGLKREETIDEIVQSLASRFGEPTDKVRSDILAFIAQLAQSGLVRPDAGIGHA